MSIFPHQKLDWNTSRLEKRLDSVPDDAVARLDYALACLSRAQFHEGGEPWYNRALTHARRVLQHDPANPSALVAAGVCLVGLDRLEPAARYLDEAIKVGPERADVHLGMGLYHQAMRHLGGPQQGANRHQAVRELEMACRLAPDAWEPHYLLGQLLWKRASDVGGSERLLERSQFHTVRALQLGPSASLAAALTYHLGMLCLHTGRFNEAHKLFSQLLDNNRYRNRTQYYLGLVSYQMGKYKNAVLYLRQHLENSPDNPKVHARIGMAYLQLGEVAKAREACNRTLALDPDDLQARWTLGCALVEEGRVDEALKTFKAILADRPDHAPAFVELVRIRATAGDVRWLRGALRAEVDVHDRLPVSAENPAVRGQLDPAPMAHPRQSTRHRIATVLRALSGSDDDAITAILPAMDLTTDEGLRFFLWEAALDTVASRRAAEMTAMLKDPSKHFSAERGRQVLALATSIPEQLLIGALQIDEEDLRRAAVNRNGPARDVLDHRKAIDTERRAARAWQALLLLAIASHQSRSSRTLLVRWASEADADLADAAKAALVLLGDADAAESLRKRAHARGASNLVDAMLTQLSPPESQYHARPVGSDADLQCTTCSRRSSEVDHMLQGANAALCNRCFTEIARDRRLLRTDDPQTRCKLCNKNNLEARGVYVYRNEPVCQACVDQSLGLVEREEVDRYLAAQ